MTPPTDTVPTDAVPTEAAPADVVQDDMLPGKGTTGDQGNSATGVGAGADSTR